MQRYVCHKVVEAAAIVSCVNNEQYCGVYVGPNEDWVDVPQDFFARGTPASGDYLVKYEPDGYLSWSPKDVFEAGYSKEQK